MLEQPSMTSYQANSRRCSGENACLRSISREVVADPSTNTRAPRLTLDAARSIIYEQQLWRMICGQESMTSASSVAQQNASTMAKDSAISATTVGSIESTPNLQRSAGLDTTRQMLRSAGLTRAATTMSITKSASITLGPIVNRSGLADCENEFLKETSTSASFAKALLKSFITRTAKVEDLFSPTTQLGTCVRTVVLAMCESTNHGSIGEDMFWSAWRHAERSRNDYAPASAGVTNRWFVDLPSQIEREAILRIHIERTGRDIKKFKGWEKLAGSATLGYTGAELEAIVKQAMFDAFSDGQREFTTKDIENAIAVTVPLIKTKAKEIEDLRKWASNKARQANQGEMVKISAIPEKKSSGVFLDSDDTGLQALAKRSRRRNVG